MTDEANGQRGRVTRDQRRELWRGRMRLLAASIFATAFVIYASLVPLQYTPLPWGEAVAAFEQIPWLSLSLEHRADWVANGLILLPSGFLAAGALDWRRKGRLPLLLGGPVIAAVLIGVVFGIEFTQLWFPPRVVSQNDIFAGVIGAVGGVVLWWLAGRQSAEFVSSFLHCRPGLQRWWMLVQLGMLGILLFNFMPLDVLLSRDEWSDKRRRGDLVLIPLSDFRIGAKPLLLLAYAAARLGVYGVFAYRCLTVRSTIVSGLLWSIAFELAKVPVHSRTASATNVLASCLGLAAGLMCAPLFWRLLPRFDRAICWWLAAVGWSCAMLAGFLSRYERMLVDPELIQQRLRGIIAIPFARAHASSEFQAGENILLKLLVFALLAFLLFGWCSRIHRGRIFAILLSLTWIGLLAIGIEVAQVYLPPLVPDATDFILYGAGAIVGVIGLRWMVVGAELRWKPSDEASY